MSRHDEFLFGADAFGITGRISPDDVVTTYPAAALPASGGISVARLNNFSLGTDLSIEDGEFLTWGSYEHQLQAWITISTAWRQRPGHGARDAYADEAHGDSPRF